MPKRTAYYLNGNKERLFYKINVPIIIDKNVYDLMVKKYGIKNTKKLIKEKYVDSFGEHNSLFHYSHKLPINIIDKLLDKIIDYEDNEIFMDNFEEGIIDSYIKQICEEESYILED